MPDISEDKIVTPTVLTFTLRGPSALDESDFEPDEETAETGEDDDSENGNGDYDEGMEFLDVMMYGEIGDSMFAPGISAKAFGDNLSKYPKAKSINLMINSGGGDVFEAQAIYSQLKRHSAKKVVRIDGIAASAASVIAMAGDEIIMPTGSMMMIHNASTVAAGDYRDMAKASETLKEVNETIVGVYKDRTGLPVNEIRDMMDEETWMSSAKAKKKGFATSSKGKVKAMLRVDNQILINGISFSADRFKTLPPRIKTVEASILEKEVVKENLKEKEMTPEEIKAQVDAGKLEAITSERARIADLNELDAPETHEIVAQAKEDGRTASDIMKECFAAVKARKTEVTVEDTKGKEYLAKLQNEKSTVVVNSGEHLDAPKTAKAKMIDIDGFGQMTVEEFHKKFSDIKVTPQLK